MTSSVEGRTYIPPSAPSAEFSLARGLVGRLAPDGAFAFSPVKGAKMAEFMVS